MAVTITNNLSSLRIRFDLGEVLGKTKTKSKTFSNLKHTALEQDVFDVANALIGLQSHDLLEIIKQDYTSLNA